MTIVPRNENCFVRGPRGCAFLGEILQFGEYNKPGSPYNNLGALKISSLVFRFVANSVLYDVFHVCCLPLASASDEQESSDDEEYNEADDMKDSQDPAGADASGDGAKVCT